MSGRVGNQLPNNLPQLQNCIKRDAESYIDEFRLQQQRFEAVMDVVKMDPSSGNKDFEDLVMFMGHVCFYVSDEMQSFAGDVTKLLKEYGPALNPGVRLAACKSLILIRNRGLLGATDLLTLFFELLRCQDKSLRTFLRNHIITDIKNMNKKHKDVNINSQLQRFMKSMLDDSNPIASKISLEIMIELYKNHVWQDEKTVNYIAGACFSKTIKIMVTALSFFLGRDEDEKDEDDDDSDVEKDKDKKQPPAKSIRDVEMANKFNKKSNKRKNKLERLKKAAKKETSKEKKEMINFSALSLIWNPQKMGEDLLKMLQAMNERFEVKLMVMNLISRLIAVCDVYLENFYPYLQRYLQPHQREVTKILVYAAQSSHERIPPNYIEPVLFTVVNNFISERNSNECITVGLNTVREICSRCPLVMNEDLLQDLALYQKFKDKNVAMGAKSLVQLFRGINPTLLQRKDRGRPTEATIELKPKEYGELDAKDYVPGAEVLVKKILENSEDEDEEEDDEEEEDWEDYDTNNESLQQVSDDEDNDGEENDSEDEEEEDDDGEEDWEEEEEMTDERDEKKETKEKVFVSRAEENKERLKQIQDEAALVSSTRLLTDEEFKMIRKNQQRKHSEAIHRKKRKNQDSDEEDDSDSDDEESQRKELVSLSSIERLYKKARSDKAGRLATTMEGREGRDKYVWKRKKNPFSSTKQSEKNRNKAFTMVKHKLRGKKKKSFHEKQAQLKKSLIKQMKVMK